MISVKVTAVKWHDLAPFASHSFYLPVLEMTNSSAART